MDHKWARRTPLDRRRALLGRVRLQVLGGYRRVEHHDPTPSYLHLLAPDVTPLPSPSYVINSKSVKKYVSIG